MLNTWIMRNYGKLKLKNSQFLMFFIQSSLYSVQVDHVYWMTVGSRFATVAPVFTVPCFSASAHVAGSEPSIHYATHISAIVYSPRDVS